MQLARPAFASAAAALAVLLSACGGSVSVESSDSVPRPDGGTDAPSDDALPDTPCFDCQDDGGTCPVAEPVQGTPCTEGESCDYGSGCSASKAVCVGEAWSIEYFPCPPPQCPSSEPPAGLPCSDPMQCTFPNSCGGEDSLQCDGKTWVLEGGSCTTGGCPTSEPKPGSPCSDTSGTECSWPSATCKGGIDYGACSAGVWVEKTSCVTPACPPVQPIQGTACSPSGEQCTYPNSCGGSTEAICQGAQWQLLMGDCPPPPPCPISTPGDGSYCPSSGQICKTTSQCGGTDLVQCTGNLWKVQSVGSCEPPTPCPTTTPPPGVPCSPTSGKCTTKSACGGSDIIVCTAGTWQIGQLGACPSCPTNEPPNGGACSKPSLQCQYQNGCGGFDQALCTPSGRWSVSQTCVVNGCPPSNPNGQKCSTPSSSGCEYPDGSCGETCYCLVSGAWGCVPNACPAQDAGPPPPF